MSGVTEQEVFDVQDAYKTMYVGMIEKDAKVLREVLDDSFILVHMTGMRQSKEAFIRAVQDGTLNYYFAEHQSMEVTELTDAHARLDGKSMVNAAVFGGGKHTWRLRQQLQLTKKDSSWKITVAVASTY